MPATLALLFLAILSGTLLTYLYDLHAPLAARLCAGACTGLALLALIGFLLASFFGLHPLALLLTAAVVASPFGLLVKPAYRARAQADIAAAARGLRDAVLHPTWHTTSCVIFYAVVCLLPHPVRARRRAVYRPCQQSGRSALSFAGDNQLCVWPELSAGRPGLRRGAFCLPLFRRLRCRDVRARRRVVARRDAGPKPCARARAGWPAPALDAGMDARSPGRVPRPRAAALERWLRLVACVPRSARERSRPLVAAPAGAARLYDFARPRLALGEFPDDALGAAAQLSVWTAAGHLHLHPMVAGAAGRGTGGGTRRRAAARAGCRRGRAHGSSGCDGRRLAADPHAHLCGRDGDGRLPGAAVPALARMGRLFRRRSGARFAGNLMGDAWQRGQSAILLRLAFWLGQGREQRPLVLVEEHGTLHPLAHCCDRLAQGRRPGVEAAAPVLPAVHAVLRCAERHQACALALG